MISRRRFLNWLAAVPFVGLLVPKTEATEPVTDVGTSHPAYELPAGLPDHFPRNLVIIDADGKSHPVPVVVTDDGTYPGGHFLSRSVMTIRWYTIQLPLVTINPSGMVITTFCYFDEDMSQISEQLISHYNEGTYKRPGFGFDPVRINTVADNRPTIQELMWPDHVYSTKMPEGFHILKYRMSLRKS